MQKTFLGRIPLVRLAWIQMFKRNPINLRRIFGIPKGENSKGLGLFLTGYCNLYKTLPESDVIRYIEEIGDRLLACRTTGFSGDCWGYNFDWQNRAFFLPAGTPTVVATSFVARALMDAYDVTGKEQFLSSALSACAFVTTDLNRSKVDGGFIFSYSPLDQTRVYNASMLGSYLLARASTYDARDEWKDMAISSAAICANRQREDGAWIYGELSVQDWVDSFHTGYMLECLFEVGRHTGSKDFSAAIERGSKYYFDRFFLADGTPKYHDTCVYPIDIHSPAQLIVAVSRLGLFEAQQDLVENVLNWTVRNMWNSDGYFDYRISRFYRTSIPYMRWSQAWMFYALSFYLVESSVANLGQ